LNQAQKDTRTEEKDQGKATKSQRAAWSPRPASSPQESAPVLRPLPVSSVLFVVGPSRKTPPYVVVTVSLGGWCRLSSWRKALILGGCGGVFDATGPPRHGRRGVVAKTPRQATLFLLGCGSGALRGGKLTGRGLGSVGSRGVGGAASLRAAQPTGAGFDGARCVRPDGRADRRTEPPPTQGDGDRSLSPCHRSLEKPKRLYRSDRRLVRSGNPSQ
jgi:hypothetical protein